MSYPALSPLCIIFFNFVSCSVPFHTHTHTLAISRCFALWVWRTLRDAFRHLSVCVKGYSLLRTSGTKMRLFQHIHKQQPRHRELQPNANSSLLSTFVGPVVFQKTVRENWEMIGYICDPFRCFESIWRFFFPRMLKMQQCSSSRVCWKSSFNQASYMQCRHKTELELYSY